MPLPLATHSLFPITRTAVGYQPTGINPVGTLCPCFFISNTAIQLLSAFAINKSCFLGCSAILLEVDPLGEFGKRAASSVSITFFVASEITETVLSFALQTNNLSPAGVINISLGLSPTPMKCVHCLLSRSKTSTLSPPQQET